MTQGEELPITAEDYKNRGNKFFKGLFNSHKGNIDKAIIKYNRAHQLNPRDGYTLFSRAQAFAKQKQLDNAHADLDKAKQLGFDATLIDIEKAKLRNTKTF